MTKIVIILGPTASGKTKVGIELAKSVGGEIVSADSQQVWRGFDVGTAKANLTERSTVPHHLVDILDPTERFDAKRFVELADAAIADIASRGKVPFVVGGTGMYIRMLEHGLCGAPPRDEEFRAEMDAVIADGGLGSLYEDLEAKDPASAKKIHPNDKTRIVRALEIVHLTGVPASELRSRHEFSEKRYDALKVGLTCDRKELYRRIDARVDDMIAAGLVDEVKGLLAKYDLRLQPFLAVGYKEIVAYVKGEMSLEYAIRLTKLESRHFAKRQLTWFRADPEIKWFEPTDVETIASEVNKKLSMW